MALMQLTELEHYMLSSLVPFALRSPALGGPGLTDTEMLGSFGCDWIAHATTLAEKSLIERDRRGRWVAAEWLLNLQAFAQNNWQRYAATRQPQA